MHQIGKYYCKTIGATAVKRDRYKLFNGHAQVHILPPLIMIVILQIKILNPSHPKMKINP